MIGLKNFVPVISIGRELFLLLIPTPKSFKGFITLEKSLFDKLLSPINFIVNLDFMSKPKINLAKVPEFPALIVIFFSKLKPFNPNPSI